MGGSGSTGRKVSFGLDAEEKVTVVTGVKLSGDVYRRMKETQGQDSAKPTPTEPSHEKPTKQPTGPETAAPPATEIQEELLRNFARQQELVQEQLARLAEREKEAALSTGQRSEVNTEVILERGKAQQEKDKAKLLPADVDAWARQLETKEKELASISAFYKEQLEILEKKNLENYRQTAEQYNEAAAKAEAHIRPRFSSAVCSELQTTVLECYRQNPEQTLRCSALAKQYRNCVQQAKKGSMTNHG